MVAFLNARCRDEGEVNNIFPLYLQLAKVKKTERLDLFQDAINHLLDE